MNSRPSLVDAEDGGAKAIAHRSTLAHRLMKMLRQLAHYVEHNCNNQMPTFQPVTKVRRVLIKGLTPGVTYAFQARALLASGYTDWSDSVSRICL